MLTPEVGVPSLPRRWRSALGVQVALLLILAGFYWKITLTRQFTWLGGPDIAIQVLPWFEEQARQVHNGMLPLWDPHLWLGAPMLGQAQPGTAYPLNWLLFLMPESDGHIRTVVLNWYFVVIHYMAALFCYLLCRYTGCSRSASLIGGLLFSLAAYVGTTDWPQMVNGAVWAPLVFLFLLRALDRTGLPAIANAASSGTCLGIAWLSGHHQVPIFTTVAAAGLWLYYTLRHRRIDWPIAGRFAVMIVFLFLVSAAQTLPAQEYGHLAMRWVSAPQPVGWNDPVPYGVHANFSLTLSSLIAIVFPGIAHHADPYLGVAGLTLALLGLALAWNRPRVQVFGAIALGAIIYSLGVNSTFQGLLYGLLPMLDKARVPSMAVILFGLGAAVLAAIAVDSYPLHSQSPWPRRAIAALLAFALLVFTVFLAVLFVEKMNWQSEDRFLIAPFAALLLAALLYAWRAGSLTRMQAVTLLVMLLVLELGNDSGYGFVDLSSPQNRIFLDQVTGNSDLARYLRQQPGPFRIETATPAISANWATYHNFDAVFGNGASVATNVYSLEFHTWQTRFLLGVKYTLGGDKPPFSDSRDVYQSESNIKIYENPSVFPRAWTVHEMVQVSTIAQGLELVSEHLVELRRKAFSMKPLAALAACDSPDVVSIPRYTAEALAIEATMGCDGMVVLSDAYFPGWKAKLDGKPVPIYEVDLALRGVYVPQGSHRITMRYRPASVYLGALLSFLGIAGAAILAIVAGKSEVAH